MDNQVQTLQGSTEIKSPADKFYNFFRNDMNKLVTIVPGSFKSVELVQGQEGSVGAVKLWKYALGGVTLSVKLETVAIDDVNRSLRFKAIDGDVLLLYNSYEFAIDVKDGLVQWTIYYEMANITAPPPDAYIAFAIMVSKLVDAYLLNINRLMIMAK